MQNFMIRKIWNLFRKCQCHIDASPRAAVTIERQVFFSSLLRLHSIATGPAESRTTKSSTNRGGDLTMVYFNALESELIVFQFI